MLSISCAFTRPRASTNDCQDEGLTIRRKLYLDIIVCSRSLSHFRAFKSSINRQQSGSAGRTEPSQVLRLSKRSIIQVDYMTTFGEDTKRREGGGNTRCAKEGNENHFVFTTRAPFPFCGSFGRAVLHPSSSTHARRWLFKFGRIRQDSIDAQSSGFPDRPPPPPPNPHFMLWGCVTQEPEGNRYLKTQTTSRRRTSKTESKVGPP